MQTYTPVAQTVKLQVLAEIASGQRRYTVTRLANIAKASAYRQSLIQCGILKVAK